INDNYNFIATTFSVGGTLFLNYNTDNTYSFIASSAATQFQNLVFEIEFLTDQFCRIKHSYNGFKYYLNYYNTSTFAFSAGIDFTSYNVITAGTIPQNTDVFKYILDKSGKIVLRRAKSDGNGSYGVVVYDTSTAKLKLSTFGELAANRYSSNSIFWITYPTNIIDPKLNTSWISYDTGNINLGNVNNTKSSFNIPGNSVVHYEYNNNNSTLDVLKLKNIFSEKHISKRASNMYLSGADDRFNTPAPIFRKYTGIHTGGNSENAYNNLSLSYVGYEKDFLVDPNLPTEINTPGSLYPYTQLNVNDTSFVKDGAFGSQIPQTSDRIYTLNPLFSGGTRGDYLVTWLSASNVGDYGVWLDRYYYPDIITRQVALSAPATRISLNHPAQTLLNTQSATISISPFVDKISDLVFTPNNTYYYERVNNSTLKEFVSGYDGLVYNT
ncbi:MAG: hypothetical protein EBU90_30335, partial [Proteobacteria bacterium]|nr:hypothetical protein [Pseudomonadota bacterium]